MTHAQWTGTMVFVQKHYLESNVHKLHQKLFTSGIEIHCLEIQGVPNLRGFHYRGCWLMYVQVGDFRISRGSPSPTNANFA